MSRFIIAPIHGESKDIVNHTDDGSFAMAWALLGKEVEAHLAKTENRWACIEISHDGEITAGWVVQELG